LIEGINPTGFVTWMKETHKKDYERLFKQYVKYRLQKEFENLEDG